MSYDIDTPFDGIISWANTHFKDTWNDYVLVTPSSTASIQGRNGAQCLINRSVSGENRADNWCSYAEKNQYFILSFPKFYVIPTFYSFKSKMLDDVFPVSWIVEGSLDKSHWSLIDTKTGIEELKGTGKKATFSLDRSGIFKHIKFTIKESTVLVSFCLKTVEIFGSIQYKLPTMKTFAAYLPRHYFFSILILT